MSTPLAPRSPQTSSAPLDLEQSVAGEEDPGASIDVAVAVPRGAAEDVCPRCGGTGKLAGGDCPLCRGTGAVTAGIGGARRAAR